MKIKDNDKKVGPNVERLCFYIVKLGFTGVFIIFLFLL